MRQPPENIASLDRIKDQKWEPLTGRGQVAITWRSQDYVLQRRPIKLLPRQRFVEKTTRSLWDHELFQGARGDVIDQDHNYFWLLQPRLYGEDVLPTPETWYECWHKIQQMVPDLILSLGALREVDAQDSYLDTTPILRAFLCTTAEVFTEAQKIFSGSPWLSNLPDEPDSELVLSHGDPIAKNIILGNRAVLIDWETLHFLPQTADPIHFAAYCFKKAPADCWHDISNRLFDLGLGEAAGLDATGWRKALIWGALRDFTAYPDSPASHKRWQKGLDIICR